MKKKNLRAFTLAEVLIALTVIGIVSALTIPTLVQKTNKQEYVSALQKAYSTLSQVTNQIIAENGSPKASEGGWASSAEDIYNLYKQYLNVLKDCGSGGGCSQPLGVSWLDKSKIVYWDDLENNWKVILSDGAILRFQSSVYSSCDGSTGGSRYVCSFISADINGSKKPNMMGRDVFDFVLKEDGLHPRGCDWDDCDASSNSGSGCACKVLREGRMDY